METLGNPKNTIEILNKYQFMFQKRFGQNFLIDTHVLEKIIKSAEITKDDVVLEIGPGIGTMTQYLCENAKEVIAVEIDKNLIPILTNDTLAEYDNVTILNEPSPSFCVGHHPSTLLQTRPVSAFKVPGVFLEPLELSHGHCRGFTAQDALLANGDPCVLGFGDIGGICGGMWSKAIRQMRGRTVDSHLLYIPPPPAKQPSILGKGLLA